MKKFPRNKPSSLDQITKSPNHRMSFSFTAFFLSCFNLLRSFFFRAPRLRSQTKHKRTPLGLDCEMVGVGPNNTSILARVTIVTFPNPPHTCPSTPYNQLSPHSTSPKIVYDAIVKPSRKVTDYRTKYSGMTSALLSSSSTVPFDEARRTVLSLLASNTLVGHDLRGDLSCLGISPRTLADRDILVRDTSTYPKVSFIPSPPSPCDRRVLFRLTNQLLNHSCSRASLKMRLASIGAVPGRRPPPETQTPNRSASKVSEPCDRGVLNEPKLNYFCSLAVLSAGRSKPTILATTAARTRLPACCFGALQALSGCALRQEI